MFFWGVHKGSPRERLNLRTHGGMLAPDFGDSCDSGGGQRCLFGDQLGLVISGNSQLNTSKTMGLVSSL